MAKGLFLEVPSALFVKVKLNSEISGFGEVVGKGHEVIEFQQKGEVGIDEGDGIPCKGSCVSVHQ